MNTTTVAVTMRALLQRINRKLRHDDEVLCVTRGDSSELGHYHAVDLRRNCVSAKGIDPEEWGRELGVLREWEEVK